MGLGKPDQSENEISNVLKRKQCLDFKLGLDIYVVDAGNLFLKRLLDNSLDSVLNAYDIRLDGGSCWIRTSDQLIKSQLLYQLS